MGSTKVQAAERKLAQQGASIVWNNLTETQRYSIFVRSRVPLNQSQYLLRFKWERLPAYIRNDLWRLDWQKILRGDG